MVFFIFIQIVIEYSGVYRKVSISSWFLRCITMSNSFCLALICTTSEVSDGHGQTSCNLWMLINSKTLIFGRCYFWRYWRYKPKLPK